MACALVWSKRNGNEGSLISVHADTDRQFSPSELQNCTVIRFPKMSEQEVFDLFDYAFDEKGEFIKPVKKALDAVFDGDKEKVYKDKKAKAEIVGG